MKVSEYTSNINNANNYDEEVIDILESLPTLLYEFKCNEKNYDNGEYTYTKSVYPLFDKDVVDDESNKKLLYTLVSRIPYYYIEPTNVIYANAQGLPEEYILQDTRDSGVNNVPSPLQTSEFWQTWFRDTWGYIQNALILDIYNKLQFPYVNENLYLNNTLFSKLAIEGFNSSTDGNSYVGFIDTEEENNNVYKKSYEFYGEEIGCLDNIENIVNQKINSEYYLIDYKDTSTLLLSKWGESLYYSGCMSYEELDSAKMLFKLQDIKNEFMRRKFAGSRSLYQLVVDSIDRKGSFVLAVNESELKNSEYNSFNSKRLFKVISLPGITSKFIDYESDEVEYGSILNTYCYESEDIPLNTLVPLFYSSSNLGLRTANTYYSTEQFFSNKITSNVESYRIRFLRDNINILDWNNLKGINLSDNVATAYDILDLKDYDDDGNEFWANTLDKEGEFMILDAETSKIDITYANKSILDISADRILYHKNTIQQLLDTDYQYVKYPIADNNGLSLMDTYWVDYVEKEISMKSKVQNNTDIGVQLSTVKQLYRDKVVIDHDFFAISYTDINYQEGCNFKDIEIRDYKDGDRFALLWYCTISYKYGQSDIVNRVTDSFTKRLISVISLANNFKKSYTSKYTDSEYDMYKYYNVGVLPLTYSKAVDNTLWVNYSGYYLNSDKTSYSFTDNLNDLGYSKAIYAFSSVSNMTSDYLYKRSITDSDLFEFTQSSTGTILSKLPVDKNIQTVYYTVKRLNETKLRNGDNSTYDYYWSEPIHVISLTSFLEGISNSKTLDSQIIYENDDSNLRYYLNPYLNFTSESASSLRHRTRLLRDGETEDSTVGPKKNTMLCSQAVNNSDSNWLCNDLGESNKVSADNTYGYYLQKFNEFTENGTDSDYHFSYAYIEGGNKNFENPYLYASTAVSTNNVYSEYSDKFNIPALSITPKFKKIYRNETIDDLKGKIQCMNIVPFRDDSHKWDLGNKVWDWCSSTEKSIFIDFSLACFNNKVEIISSGQELDRVRRLNNLAATEYSDTECSKLFFVIDDTNRVTLKMYNISYDTETKKYTQSLTPHYMYLLSYQSLSLYITPEGVLTLQWGEDEKDKLEYKGLWGNISSSSHYFNSKYDINGNLAYYDKLNLNTVFRVGVSISKDKAILVVNNSYQETSLDKDINIFGNFSQSYIPLFRKDGDILSKLDTLFYGNIYSLRLYNSAINNRQEALLRVSGTFRELYSFAPATYKLAYTTYKDITVLREVSPYRMTSLDTEEKTETTPSILFPNFTTLRMFNRSVWDSILLNLEPTSEVDGSYDPETDTDIYSCKNEVYYLDDCVEQEFIMGDGIGECITNINPRYMDSSGLKTLDVLYRDYNNPISLNNYDNLAIINTLVEPLNYTDTPIHSSSSIAFAFSETAENSVYQKINSEISETLQYILIPKSIDSSDDTFSYSADVNFNLTISPSFDSTKWLSKGSNVDLLCIPQEDSAIITTSLLDNSILSSTQNNIVMPLVVPFQSMSSSDIMYLDRFYFSNVVLSSAFTKFLNASSYYTEIQIPVAIQYTTTEYQEVKGARLIETSDNKPDNNKDFYYYYNDNQNELSGIKPEYEPLEGATIFEVVDTEKGKDITRDIIITDNVLYRGKQYYSYKNDSSSVTIKDIEFLDSYGLDGYYFIKSITEEGDVYFILWTQNTFDATLEYYNYDGILKKFEKVSESEGSSESKQFDNFKPSVIYYEDLIVPNRYYTKEEDNTYKAYTDTQYFHSQNTSQLYEHVTINHLEYVNKWDAIRTLKEGTYYFTCKYPIQIMPFMDNEFDGDSSNLYTTYYASARFKLEVKGTPYLDTNTSYDIDGTPRNLMSDKLAMTLESSSWKVSPDDNGTFPHRKISIDLYALECNNIAGKMKSTSTEDYSFRWEKVASNYEESEGVVLLDSNTISGNIVLTKKIPMYLEKSYTSAFFVAAREKTITGWKENSNSADDDIVNAIKIYMGYNNIAKEKIKCNTEDEMDKQVLIAGKSYKVIFDYTGRVSEISFIDKYYNGSVLSDSEKVNYTRLVNLLDTDFLNTKDYMYDSNGRAFNLNGTTNINSKTSGFKIDNSNGYYYWTTYSTSNTYYSSTFTFGNPYSRATSKNYILSRKSSNTQNVDSRENINNSYTFPYMVTDNTHGTKISAYPSYIGVITSSGNYATMPLDIPSIAKKQYETIKNTMTSAITTLKSKADGLFSGISEIQPNFISSNDSYKDTINVDSNGCSIYGYYSSRRQLPIGNNNITITRKTLNSNNLLKNSTFDNSIYWVLNNGESPSYNNGFTTTWVSDTSWDDGVGKDVFQITNNSKRTTTLKYRNSTIGLNAVFEIAINLRMCTGSISSVTADIIYNGRTEKTLTLKAEYLGDSWYNYTANTEEAVSCDSIQFNINYATSTSRVLITKAIVRKSNTISHKLGFYDALNETNLNSRSTYISVNGHSMVLFKYPSSIDSQTYAREYPNEYFPIQFNNSMFYTVSSGGKKVYRPKSGTFRISNFINSHKKKSKESDESRLTELMNPFVRRISISKQGEDVSVEVHKYAMYKDTLGIYNKEEVKSNVTDIIQKMTSEDIEFSQTANKKYYRLNFLNMPLNLNSSKQFTTYDINVGVNTDSPFTLANETFSILFNSLNPDNYRKGIDTPVAVTNVQLLLRENENKRVVYEFEFLPIIYSELNSHVAFNILMYKRSNL